MRRWRPVRCATPPSAPGLGPNDVELLTAATTVPDLLGPGLASMVHGELGYGPLEIATAHGICTCRDDGAEERVPAGGDRREAQRDLRGQRVRRR